MRYKFLFWGLFFICLIAFNTTQTFSDMKQRVILGSTKAEVIEIFNLKGWTRNFRYEEKVNRKGIKFENQDLIVVILFNDNGIAEGVAFLSQDVSDPTGKNSYANKNYQTLVNLATGGQKVKVENNKGTHYPNEVYIGKMPY
jgi:hypothetical protein